MRGEAPFGRYVLWGYEDYVSSMSHSSPKTQRNADSLPLSIPQTLRVTPAIAAGVTGKLWELTDIVKIVDEWGTRANDSRK